MHVIQLAAVSGPWIIATASPQNHALKSRGVHNALESRFPQIAEHISRLTHGRLEYIYDCIFEFGAAHTAVECLPGASGKVVLLLPVDPWKLIEPDILAISAIPGNGFLFGKGSFPANTEDKEWSEKMCYLNITSWRKVEGKSD